jgi:hypothetical protein
MGQQAIFNHIFDRAGYRVSPFFRNRYLLSKSYQKTFFMHKNMKNAYLISASIVHQKISPAILLAGKTRNSVAILG